MTDGLLSWASELGCRRIGNVAICEDGLGGHGLQLAPDVLPANDIALYARLPLIAVPEVACLHAGRFDEWLQLDPKVCSSWNHLMALDDRSEDERLKIILFILAVRFSQNRSLDLLKRYIPYIASFPQKMNHLVNWPAETLERLDVFHAARAAYAKRVRLKREFQSMKDHFTPLSNVEVTFDDWLWADGIVWSRAISIRSASSCVVPFDLHLVPIVDFCNHSNKPNVRWEVEDDGPASYDILLSTYDQVSLSPQTPLHLSYGSKSNTDLLFSHGFVLPDNQFDTFDFHVSSLLDRSDPLLPQRVLLLKQLNAGMILLSAQHLPSDATKDIDPENILGIFPVEQQAPLLVPSLDEEDLEKFGCTASSASAIVDILKKSNRWEILQLRVIVLMDALLRGEYEKLEEWKTDDLPAVRLATIKLYRTELLKLLQVSLSYVETAIKVLSQTDVVQQYLALMNEQ